jgi:hypothetical protein
MIDNYVTHLVNDFLIKYNTNNPNNPNKHNHINLVLEGGLFNGSYLTGCLFYLKELEKRNYIKIQKLSGCSIGSIIALLYFLDDEEVILNIYKLAYKNFKEKYNVNIFNKIFKILNENLPTNIMDLIKNKKIYITYFNVENCKQIIKCKYKSIEDLFETVRRSCSFPYIVDNSIYYKKKYIDGLYPYVFPCKNDNVRTLYLNIHNLNKIPGMLSVKNETTNIHRVLEGVIESHIFFTNSNKTNICSFTDEWNLYDLFFYYIFILSMKIFVFILNKVYIINNLINKSIIDSKININKLFYNIYIFLLNNYCI